MGPISILKLATLKASYPLDIWYPMVKLEPNQVRISRVDQLNSLGISFYSPSQV